MSDLLKTETLFKTVHEFGMIYTDTSGRIIDLNIGAEILFGYKISEMINNSAEMFFSEENIQQYFNQYELVQKHGKYSYITQLVKKNGIKFWASMSLSKITNDVGELQGILIVIHDKTEQVTNKKKMQSLIKFPEETPYPILRVNHDGKLIFSNQASKPFLKSWKSSGLYVPERIKAIISDVISQGKAISKEFKLENQIYLFSFVPVDEFINIYAIDITDRKKALMQVIREKERAEKLSKLKTEFLAQMSHEIRTPVNVILNYIFLIREELEMANNQDIMEWFEAIDNGSSRLVRTMDLILNYSTVQSGNYELNKQEVDLEEHVILPELKKLKRLAAEKGLKLSYKNPLVEVKVHCDVYSVTEIFSQILDNAIKFTREGQVIVKVADDYEGYLKLVITDTGVGISKDFLPDLFSPFMQEEHGYTRSYDGNGLGLSLARKLAELNDIKIKVASEPKVGSRFTIFIPN